MSATKENARAVAAAPGAEALSKQQQHRQFTAKPSRRKPPYSRQFRLGPRQTALVCLGWPPVQPPDPTVLVLPDGQPPDAFDWSLLCGQYVICTPPPDEIADHQTLRELGMELVAAGVHALILDDGAGGWAEWWADASERPRGAP